MPPPAVGTPTIPTYPKARRVRSAYERCFPISNSASITGDLPVPVVESCVRARLCEGIARLADPASFHLSAREDLTQGTDLAFPSVMSRPIVILRTPREGGRGCAKDAENYRRDQGRPSILEHCVISKAVVAFCMINRGAPRFIPRPHSKAVDFR